MPIPLNFQEPFSELIVFKDYRRGQILFAEDISADEMKLTLALGAGAAMGCAHIGVILALQEAGINIDAVAGSSMGALVGAFLAAGKLTTLKEILDTMSVSEVKRHLDLFTSFRGLIEGKIIERKIRKELTGLEEGVLLIEQLSMPFIATATSLKTFEQVLFKTGDVILAIRAAIAVPGFFTPAEHEDLILIDGGIQNVVPVPAALTFDKNFVLGVDVYRASLFNLLTAEARKHLPHMQWRGQHPDALLSMALSKGVLRYDEAGKLIEEGYQLARERMGEIIALLRAKLIHLAQQKNAQVKLRKNSTGSLPKSIFGMAA